MSTPSYADLLYAVDGPIARVTLNRPEKRNPLGPTTIGELLHALDAARADPAVRVVVITGAGKVFSAGGDLSSFQAGGGGGGGGGGSAGGARPLESGASATTRPGSFVDLNLALTRLGKPTIARVNGHALAGGLGLVVACDLAIASTEAQLGTPEINVGLWPMMIMSTIFRNVPRKRGIELMLTGERIAAIEAERIGLVTRAVPPEELDAAVDDLAHKIAAKSPKVVALGMEAFYATQDLAFEPMLRELERGLMAVLATDDAREGLQAFLEKRAPRFSGT